jgi:glycine betaine/proline transport system ATP-binding protein
MELSRVMQKTTVFITHDLDEAMRVGKNIAIMRDGRIVQVGTPAQIITNPADQYVADFVAGVSELKVVKASDVMSRPVGVPDQKAPRALPDASLGELAALAAATDCPVAIVDRSGNFVGVVDRVSILNGISRKLGLG